MSSGRGRAEGRGWSTTEPRRTQRRMIALRAKEGGGRGSGLCFEGRTPCRADRGTEGATTVGRPLPRVQESREGPHAKRELPVPPRRPEGRLGGTTGSIRAKTRGTTLCVFA